MSEATIRIPATLDFLIPWLKRYAEDQKPDDVKGWEFVAGKQQTLMFFGVLMYSREQRAAIHGVPWGDTKLPLIEFWLDQPYAECQVRMRCNVPGLEPWFQELLTAMIIWWRLPRGAASSKAEPEARQKSPRSGKGVPRAERDRICEEWWEAARQNVKQETFCYDKGISPSSLRAWCADLKARRAKM